MDMLHGQDNPKISQAKDAVKQQLLRVIVKQASEELSTIEDAELTSRLERLDFHPMAADFGPALKKRIVSQLTRKAVSTLDADDEALSEVISDVLDTDKESGELVAQIREKLLGKIESLVHGKLSETVSNSEEIAREIAESAQIDIDSDLQEAVSILERRTRDAVGDRLSASEFDTDSIAKEVAADIPIDVDEHIEAAVSIKKQRTREALAERIESADVNSSEMAEEFADSIPIEVEGELDGALAILEWRTREKIQEILSDVKSDINGVANEIAKNLPVSVDSKLEGARAILIQRTKDELEERLSRADLGIKQIAEDIAAETPIEVDEEVEQARQILKTRIKDELVARVFEQRVEDYDLAPEVIESLTMDESYLGLTADEVRADWKERLIAQIKDRIRETVDSASELEEIALARFIGEGSWLKDAITEAMHKLRDMVAEETTHLVAGSEQFVTEAFEQVSAQTDIVEKSVAQIRRELVDRVAQKTLSGLDDFEPIVGEAREFIAFDNDVLVAATAVLRNKILQDLAARVIQSMADPQATSEDARTWITGDDPAVVQVADQIRRRATETITHLVLNDFADAERVSTDVSNAFDESSVQVRNVLDRTNKKMIQLISGLMVERLRDTDEMAATAASEIPMDHEVVMDVVDKTEKLLTEEIARASEKRLQDAGASSEKARKLLKEDLPEVIQAADVLENMLLSEVSNEARHRLHDVERASERAREYVDETDDHLQTIERMLREALLESVADQALAGLEDNEQAATDARVYVQEGHAYIDHAVSVLRDILVSEIAEAGIHRIEDAEAIARESRGRMPKEQQNVLAAGSNLRELLIDEVVKRSLASMADPSITAEEALAKIDPDHEVIVAAKRVIRDRLTERLFQEAIATLAGSVGGKSIDAEKAFFQTSLNILTKQAVSPQSSASQAYSGPVDADEHEIKSIEGDSPDASTEVAQGQEWIPISDIEVSNKAEDTEDPEVSNEAEVSEESEVSEKAEVSEETVSANEGTKFEDDSFQGEDASDEKKWTVNEIRPYDFERPSDDGMTSNSIPEISLGESQDSALVYYLYGIIAHDRPVEEGEVMIAGVDGESGVFILTDGFLGAIVSRVSSKSFGASVLTEKMRDTNWLKSHVRRHAAVLSEMKQIATLVPLRFGTVCDSEENVFSLIAERRPQFEKALERLYDKKEYGVRVFCDTRKLKDIVSKNEKMVDESLDEMSKGVAHFLKTELQKNGADAGSSTIKSLLESCIRRAHIALLDKAAEGVFKPLGDKNDIEGRELVMNAAYLVPCSLERQFSMALETLADEYADLGFAYEQSGPWPPYHFVDVDSGDLDTLENFG